MPYSKIINIDYFIHSSINFSNDSYIFILYISNEARNYFVPQYWSILDRAILRTILDKVMTLHKPLLTPPSPPPDGDGAAADPAQEVAAGRAGVAARHGGHVARGGQRAGLGAARGGAPHGRGERAPEGQPVALSRQSPSQGLVFTSATGDAGVIHQHLVGHHVLQAADVAAAGAGAPTPLAAAHACTHTLHVPIKVNL